MNKLLERILDIIANDAFPDEDKPYIIREVVSSWNEAKEQVPHTLNQDYGDGYKAGYEQAKDNIGTLQQREPDERYRKGYKDGTDATVIRCNMLSEPIRKVAYDKPREIGWYPVIVKHCGGGERIFYWDGERFLSGYGQNIGATWEPHEYTWVGDKIENPFNKGAQQ